MGRDTCGIARGRLGVPRFPTGRRGQRFRVNQPPEQTQGSRATDEVSITPYRDGPLIVRGPVRILDGDGHEIEAGRATIALCRCGRSALKPFCDGSHVASNFRAAAGDERARNEGHQSTPVRFDRQLNPEMPDPPESGPA